MDVQALQVQDVAGDLEQQDLSLALAEKLVPAGPSIEDEATLRGLVAVAHDVPTSVEVVDPYWQAPDRLTLRIREGGDAVQFADEHTEGVSVGD